MTSVLTFVFLCILAAAVVSFVVMGIRGHRRYKALARSAHGTGLHFSQSDLFDIPNRYGGYALIARGHSGSANNVTYGRVEKLLVRAFDFCSEMGHGTQRLTRRDSVVVVDAGRELPGLLMWHGAGQTLAPLAYDQSFRQVGGWIYRGNKRLANVLNEALTTVQTRRISVEAKGSSLLVAGPQAIRSGRYVLSHEGIRRLVSALSGWLDEASGSE